MQDTLSLKLGDVARLRKEEPSQVIAEAVDIGLSKMWTEIILSQYLQKKISRKKAIQLAGLDLVRLAEHQQKIIQDDLKWGLSDETHSSRR